MRDAFVPCCSCSSSSQVPFGFEWEPDLTTEKRLMISPDVEIFGFSTYQKKQGSRRTDVISYASDMSYKAVAQLLC
jgi:hypothetical protein